MSLEQVRYFVAVAEEQSITAAARKLRVSQPPLSRAVRALEDELGSELFERSSTGVTLRPAGRLFLEHARRILDSVSAAIEAVSDPPSG